MRQLRRICVSYLNEDAIEELQREQRNDDENHANRNANIDKYTHIAIEHGEQRVLMLIDNIHKYGKICQMIAAADAVRAIRRLETAAIGRPGTVNRNYCLYQMPINSQLSFVFTGQYSSKRHRWDC